MVDRIDLILKAKNITARQFAEEIGIQPSGMSHIMSGRNNPSLDFVMKVMRRWPEININWLMFGKGEMFADPSSLQPARPAPAAYPLPSPEPDLFSLPPDEPPSSQLQPQPEAPSPQPQPLAEPPAPQQEPQPEPPAPQPKPQPESPESQPEPVIEATLPPAGTPIPASQPQLNENRLYVPPQPSVPVQPNPAPRRAVKVIVFYSDQTFSEFTPSAS